jgi:antitoxin component of MazEF toxin-antitoxin module
MVKQLQKIGNSRGIVIDKAILSLLNMDEKGAFEVVPKDGGLFLKPVNLKDIYNKVAKRHRKSLDKLGK